MFGNMSGLRDFIREVHRRSIWWALGAYIAVSWLVFEVIQQIAESADQPWLPNVALALLLIGLPVVVGTALVKERQQSTFAGLIAEGEAHSVAYRKAYNTAHKSDAVVSKEASALASKPKVIGTIEALKAEVKTAQEVHEKLSNEWIIQRLQDEAINDKNPADTRVRALELLGKTGRLFDESTHCCRCERRDSRDFECSD